MAQPIKTAAVLGAGYMGSHIAAHLSGVGVKVHLLDIVPPKLEGEQLKDPAARNGFAAKGLQAALDFKPAAFYDKDSARLVEVGNFDDHIDRIKDADLIIEAVVERLDIKLDLFKKVAPHVKDDALLASNTSGLSIASMSDAIPAELQKRFLGMHFFSPVRYMRLLEIIPGPQTEGSALTKASAIGDMLGKGVVYAKDTPNFIANRIGIHAAMLAIHTADEMGLSIEDVDAITGAPMGRPKSGTYRLGDMVGIDVIGHVSNTCHELVKDDPEREVFKAPKWVHDLVESGRVGQKAGAGFYKKEGKTIFVLDKETLEYREQNKNRYDSIGATKGKDDPGERIKIMVNGDDTASEFAWKILSRSLCYSARLMGEIADDVVNVDRAMRWGFNWDLGPFQIWDAIGVKESVARMQKEGMEVPAWVIDMVESGIDTFYSPQEADKTFFDYKAKSQSKVPFDPRYIRLDALKEDKKNVVIDKLGASLIDIGDGVVCLEVHTKMNTIDQDVIDMLWEACDEAEKNFEAMVIGNDGQHFGAGANLMMIMMAAQQKAFDQIEPMIKRLQHGLQRVRYAGVPVVSAPHGLTLGGGAEIAMAADATEAFAETYMGLVEVGVGLVPAGGGCLRMVERWTEEESRVEGVDVLPFIAQPSLNIAMAKVATGAEEARALRYIRATDSMVLNRDLLLYNAKQRALGMARAGYRPARPRVLRAAGYDAKETILMRVEGLKEGGYASEHDGLVASKVAHILCGGNVRPGTELTEEYYLDLEREAFMSLCGEEKTVARIQHMLMKNKPLRN